MVQVYWTYMKYSCANFAETTGNSRRSLEQTKVQMETSCPWHSGKLLEWWFSLTFEWSNLVLYWVTRSDFLILFHSYVITRFLSVPSAYAFGDEVQAILTLICKISEFIKNKKDGRPSNHLCSSLPFHAIFSLFSPFQFRYPYPTYSYNVQQFSSLLFPIPSPLCFQLDANFDANLLKILFLVALTVYNGYIMTS